MNLSSLVQGLGDYRRLRRNPRILVGPELQAWQRERMEELARYAVAHSPFYRELYRGADLADPLHLPVIDKQAYTRHFDDLNTAGLKREDLLAFALDQERRRDHLGYYRAPDGREYTVGMSSGTSGNKMLVVWDRPTTERLPFVFLARSGLPLSRLPLRIAFLLRIFNQAFQNINAPGITLRYFSTMTPLPDLARELDHMGVNVLMAPPSLLRVLLPFRDRIRCRLHQVVCYAEVLDDHDKEMFAAAFQAPVVQIYQASEGPLATPCHEGNLHLNEDLMVVEPLDEEGRPVTAPMVPCRRLVVTNLYNRVAPILRYALNDVLVLGHPCPCGSGFRTVARVVGRNDDVLWLPTREGPLRPVFPDLVSRWIISAAEDVLEYQVEQASPHHLRIRVLPTPEADRADLCRRLERTFRRELASHGCVPPSLHLHLDGPVHPAGAAKFKRFIRLFPEPTQEG